MQDGGFEKKKNNPWRNNTGYSTPIEYRNKVDFTSDRSAEKYRRSLFPEFRTVPELTQFLEDKFWIDIGSGFTHLNEKSLHNKVASKAEEKGKTPHFFGVDPVNSEKTSRLGVIKYLLSKIMTIAEPPERPAEKYTANWTAEELASLDELQGTVDFITSNWSIGVWIQDPKTLLRMFTIFHRLLKVGGEIRLAPVYETDLIPDEDMAKFVDAHFDVIKGKKRGVTILRKKS